MGCLTLIYLKLSLKSCILPNLHELVRKKNRGFDVGKNRAQIQSRTVIFLPKAGLKYTGALVGIKYSSRLVSVYGRINNNVNANNITPERISIMI